MKEELPSQTATPSKQPASPPAELQGKELSALAGTPNPSADEAKSLALQRGGDGEWSKEHGQFAYFVHQYLRDFIKFADQKAAFVMAIASAILAFLIKQGAHKSLLIPIRNRSFSEWAALFSCLLIALAGFLALLVVLPRLGGKGTGIIYWKGILQSRNSVEYATRVRTTHDDRLIGHVFDHCYELAGIANRKYEILKWAIWIGAIGCLAAASVLLGF